MKRISMCLRYDGSNYHGWQVQKDVVSLQATVEEAISAVANQRIHTVCSGRTDTGVHATSQIIHFDTTAERSDRAWVFGTNSNLPFDIAVVWAKEVRIDFHARFSALSRRYRYVLYNHSTRPGILRHAVGWWYKALDEALMRQGAEYLMGEHDFSSFRGAKCQAKSPRRTILNLDIHRVRQMVVLDIQANAFLLHMVRNIAGVLCAVGNGEKPPSWVKEVLEAKDRRSAAMTITPAGLYLVAVQYPPEFDLPRVPLGPFFLP